MSCSKRYVSTSEDSPTWGSISGAGGKIYKKSIPVEKSSPVDPGSCSDSSRHILRDVSEDVDSR